MLSFPTSRAKKDSKKKVRVWFVLFWVFPLEKTRSVDTGSTYRNIDQSLFWKKKKQSGM